MASPFFFPPFCDQGPFRNAPKSDQFFRSHSSFEAYQEQSTILHIVSIFYIMKKSIRTCKTAFQVAGVFLSVLVLNGCAHNTGVVAIGNGTFTVSRQAATGFHGMGGLRAQAMVEANEHCSAQGKSVQVLEVREAQPPFILGNFPKVDVDFTCTNETVQAKPQDGSKRQPSQPPSGRSIQRATGTGFAVGGDKTVMTAYHVVENATRVVALCSDNAPRNAVVEKIDPANDLALLSVEKPVPEHLEFAPQSSTGVGKKVFTIGFPVPGLLGFEPKYTEGSISALTGMRGIANFLQITVPIQPGNSGGAVVDENGQLVGVVTSTAAIQNFFSKTGTLPQSVNWAIKADYAKVLLSDVASRGRAANRGTPVEHVTKSTCLLMVDTN